MKIEEYTQLTLLTFFVILLLYYINWKLGRQHLYKLAAKIPMNGQISLYPFVGFVLSFNEDTEQLLNVIRRIFDKITPPRSIWMGHRYFVTINRAEDLEVVLNSSKCLAKDDSKRIIRNFTGEGLFSSSVPKWRRHRKVIMPTFNRKILEEFVKVFSEQADIFIEQLESKCGHQIDIFKYTNKFSLDAVCETAMGVSLNIQTTESDIEYAISKVMEIIMVRICNIFYHFDWIYNWTKYSRDERKFVDIFGKFIVNVIDKKMTDYKRQLADNKETQLYEKKKRTVFLEQLIELSENGENWTTEEIKAEVGTFMIAASDTTATVASFTLLLLGMHPEIQQKCYDESLEILGPDRKLEHTDLPKLIYLEKVIKESMRLFPVAPVLSRKLNDDLEVGGYILPKDSGLILGIIGTHYSELYYKDPWKFDPERFSSEEISKRHKYAYLPFSAGPRNCVGITYGMMSLKSLLAVTLRKYRIETFYKDIKEIRIKQAIIIKAVQGFPVTLYLRK